MVSSGMGTVSSGGGLAGAAEARDPDPALGPDAGPGPAGDPPARGPVLAPPSVNRKFGISVSSQNCNSLSLTGISKNLDSKVAAITASKTDIIFLSDIRIVNSAGVRNDMRVSCAFKDAKNRIIKLI